ncbi:MAG TPA: condensation domain-containing protein [Candidatus Sulfotelmatobacter sp.]
MPYGSQPLGTDAQDKSRLADLLAQASPTIYSASPAQQRLWFLQQLLQGSGAYNVHLGLWLRGALDLAALQSSIRELVNRHDSLRTSFRLESDTLQQVVESENLCDVRIAITDLTSAADPTAEAYQLAGREVGQPFDLSKAPLFRVRLIRVTPLDHVFLYTLHHIITDAWSMQIFAKELELFYTAFSRGQTPSLSVLPIRYGDFAEWQLERFQTDRVQQQVAYWKNKLEGAPALLELPTDAARPPEQTFQGAVEVTPISSDIINGIKKVADRCQATSFMVQLAAFKVLLHHYVKHGDIVVGIPVAGRNQMETEGLIGFFVNTLVLRDDLSGNPRFADVVAQVRETILDAFSNADVPFEKIVEVLQPKRNLGFNPIFQVMFATVKAAVRSHAFGDLTAYPYIIGAATSIFDLSLTLIEDIDQHWWAQIEYNTNLFKQERIRRMLADYTALLEGVVSIPEERILTLPLPSTPESADRVDVSLADGRSTKESKTTKPPAVSTRKASQRRTEPVDQEQKLLVEIWKQVVGIPEVGIRDSFFDVGGHSLMAARLVAQIHEVTGKQIPVSAIFRAPTIEAFAPLIREDKVPQLDPVLLKLQAGDDRIPFFAIAAPVVDTFGWALLARHLGPDHSVYKVQASGPAVLDRPFTKQELQTLAQEYIAAMRSVQPHGPYCLGGMCGGALIAQEVILQLEAQREEVGFFAIFDTWVLENSQIRSLWAIDYYRQRFQFFRRLLLPEKIALMKRFSQRLLLGNGKQADSVNKEWGRAYWPGRDFLEPRFQAPVLLFKRARQPYYYRRDGKMGWGKRSSGGVEICELNCGHAEFLRQPQVGIVGQLLANKLQEIGDLETQQPQAPPEQNIYSMQSLSKTLEAH